MPSTLTIQYQTDSPAPPYPDLQGTPDTGTGSGCPFWASVHVYYIDWKAVIAIDFVVAVWRRET